ncbi:MAG: glycosyltransferase, partial [Muribaculaceae bacterium]|nr:glycosyltransferase [Muribaculaceae bacterium]
QLLVVRDILNEQLIKTLAKENIEFNSGLNITTVGRLVPQKGYDLAIAAAKILKENGYEFKWRFVGGGMREELEALARAEGVADCIVFEGEQLNPYPYMAQCDIYVQTSKFEGFGLTIGEAKILGKPIVSTNFPVVYNQITPGENGLVVEMTGEAIAEGIIRLIDDKTLREKLQSNVMAEHNTTAETESTKVIDLIEK